jgi:hypothetical protein
MWTFEGQFEFDLLKLFALPPPSNHSVVFSDSLVIGPTKYYNVHTLIQDTAVTNSGNLSRVFYNVSKGVIGFKTEQGHLLYLKN